MAQIVDYINYVCYFSNEDEYNFALALAGGSTCQMSPFEASELFGFVEGVNFNTGGPINPDKGMYGVSVYGIPTVLPGKEVLFPNPSGKYVFWTVDDLLVPGQAGNPASIWPAGPDLVLKWSCNIVFQAAQIGPTVDPTEVAPIPKRRFTCGFEVQSSTIGGVSGSYTQARNASRTLEGVGFACRSNLNQTISFPQNLYVTPQDTRKTWERFYARFLTVGTEEVIMWRVLASPQPLNGCYISVASGGTGIVAVKLYNRVVGVGTLVGSFLLAAAADIEHHRFDVLLNFGAGGSTTGSIRVYIDGQLAISVTGLTTGVGSNSTHASSEIGITDGTANNGWEYDLDDWHAAEIPNISGVESLTSADWFLGTHVQLQKSDTVNPGSWTGPTESVNQVIGASNLSTTSQLASTTSGDTLEVVTDADDTPETPYNTLGLYVCVAAMRAMAFSARASGSANAQLGYKVAGGAAVLDTVSINATAAWDDSFYPGTGVDILPDSVVPASAVYVHPADTTSVVVKALALEVQYVGIFSLADGGPATVGIYYQHNAQWPTIAQAFMGPLAGPIIFGVEGGTYVGNGTQQSISVNLPFHFLYIRPVGSANPGVIWMAGQLAPSIGVQGAARPDMVARVDYDIDTGLTTFTVTGTSINNNSNGVTYQYIAICDPGYRYLINGAYQHKAAAAGPFTNPLLISSLPYDPSLGFIVQNRFTNDVTERTMFKGVGHSGTTGNIMNGTALTAMGEWGSGAWESGADAQDSGASNQATYCFIRPADTCDNTMFVFGTYTGNGTNPRSISWAPATGRYPLFIIVQPHNSAAFVKDPSDAASSSRNFTSGSASATGITGVAQDGFTVNSALNSNGVVYDFMVVLGDTAGMTNGFYYPAACDSTPLYPDPDPVEGDIILVMDGGLILDGITPTTLLKDISGIYTLVPDQHHDTVIDRNTTPSSEVDVKIPDPTFKTGYVGG